MSARIKFHSCFKGVQIYSAANTHPESKTTSLLIFLEDIGKKGLKRFRYERYNSEDHTRASNEVAKFITETLKS